MARIENYIRVKMPRSIEEAVRHAIDFNKNLTAKRSQKYINTIKKVFNKLIFIFIIHVFIEFFAYKIY